jgi:hypothetical protein
LKSGNKYKGEFARAQEALTRAHPNERDLRAAGERGGRREKFLTDNVETT